MPTAGLAAQPVPGFLHLQPGHYSPVARTCALAVLAETVRAISTFGGRALWRAIGFCMRGSMHSFSVAI